MKPLRSVTGRVAVLDRPDVDTDQIIPKQFLKRIERTGYGQYAFFDWRFDDEGNERPGFEWRLAGCSMCLGMNPDILSPGERCASTSNRNFEGRQGRGGRTHLVSPQMAAAAAIAGDTRWVRPPRPWRPSKLRLDVDAQRSPGASTSGFIPRHIEQPASRHSKPASRKIWSRPSS